MEEKNNFEPEIDFKELPKSPSRLFGWIFPYYAILFLIVGIYFIKHMDFASFNSVPANYTDSLEINANVEVKRGGIMPAVDMGLVSNPSPELIAKGKTLFATSCASCHGTEGAGDGVAASALKPPPRNFLKSEGWTNGREFTDLFKTLQSGIPGTGMIAYEYLPVEDRIAIIQYIRTLADYPKVTDKVIAELDETYELSKGIVTPNNITIEMATDKVIEDNKISTSVLDEINLDGQNSESVKLFNLYVQDKEKALSIFIRDFSKSRNADEFVSRLLLFPTESGFKSNVSLLSKAKLTKLYTLLKNVVS